MKIIYTIYKIWTWFIKIMKQIFQYFYLFYIYNPIDKLTIIPGRFWLNYPIIGTVYKNIINCFYFIIK